MKRDCWFIGGPKHLQVLAIPEPLLPMTVPVLFGERIRAGEHLRDLLKEPRLDWPEIRVCLYRPETWTHQAMDLVVYIVDGMEREAETRLIEQLATLPIPLKQLLLDARLTEGRLPLWILTRRQPLAVRLEVEWAHVRDRLFALHKDWILKTAKP